MRIKQECTAGAFTTFGAHEFSCDDEETQTIFFGTGLVNMGETVANDFQKKKPGQT